MELSILIGHWWTVAEYALDSLFVIFRMEVSILIGHFGGQPLNALKR